MEADRLGEQKKIRGNPGFPLIAGSAEPTRTRPSIPAQRRCRDWQGPALSFRGIGFPESFSKRRLVGSWDKVTAGLNPADPANEGPVTVTGPSQKGWLSAIT